MDKQTVETLISSGHASIPDIAGQFKATIHETEEFLRTNQIPFHSARDPQYRYLRKFDSVQRPNPVPWEDLVFDDPDHRIINGIDLLTTDGNVQADGILARYHGPEFRCWYTDVPTALVMSLDGSQNFLVTNLIPIAEDTIKERFRQAPLMLAGKRYCFQRDSKLNGNIAITIHLHSRLDLMFGAAFKDQYIDAVVDQWLRPYFEKFDPDQILPKNCPPTAELLSLWIWKQLCTVALLKGLARLEVEYRGVQGLVTKDQYLQMVMQIIQQAAQSRKVSTGSRILTPQQSNLKLVPDLGHTRGPAL